MEKITFSSDDKKLPLEDQLEVARMIEEYFHMKEDPERMPASRENVRWVNAHIPECVNVIKAHDKVIGSAFIIPCTKNLMHEFLDKRISERILFERIKENVSYKNFDAIYLCSVFIHPKYRGRGLALPACIKVVRRVWKLGANRPDLFYWGYSLEGKKLAKKVAATTGLKLFERKDNNFTR